MSEDADVVARIARAFDAAFDRFGNARTVGALEDETSNLIHHLYRLAVAVHGDPNGKQGAGWEALIGREDSLGLVPPLVLMRHKDVHDLVGQVEMRGIYPEGYSHFYGVLIWSLAPLMETDKRTVRYLAREKLEGKSVRSTLRDARSALVPETSISRGQISS